MTPAEKLFNVLANARTKNGGVLSKEQWLETARKFLDEFKPPPRIAKKKTSLSAALPGKPPPIEVYELQDPLVWKPAVVRLFPNTALCEWVESGEKDWFDLPISVRVAVLEAMNKEISCSQGAPPASSV